LEQVVKRRKRNSISGDLQNSAEQDLEQPANFKAGPTLSRGVAPETSRGPFPPALFCVSQSLL